MKSVFRPSTPDDAAAIVALAARAFGARTAAAIGDPASMAWKYWQPRADFGEPRAFVIERDGRIVAHAGLWLVRVDGEQGAQMFDWMSDPAAPGAGVSLLQKFTQRLDFVYSIGGTELTLGILPKFGFVTAAETLTCVRPLRPLQQILLHQHRDLRLGPRLARNLWWSRFPAAGASAGWSAEPADSVAQGERGRAYFEYLRGNPQTRCLTFELRAAGRREGVLALVTARREARVAGVWLEEPSAARWRAALELAQRTALAHTDACEIVARVSSTDGRAAAAATGMRVRGTEPVLLYKRRGTRSGLALEFQLGDNDATCMWEERPVFRT
jgi:hypothetical protein